MSMVLLTTDTLHHRYFIEKLSSQGVNFDTIFIETKRVYPQFHTGPFFVREEEEFEWKNFIGPDVNLTIDSYNLQWVKSINDVVCEGQYDLGVVFGTGVIRPKLIKRFKNGLINVHRGISQKYRGIDSDLWAIYHDDFENIGVTIHEVDATLDTGRIIKQDRLEILRNMEVWQLRYYTTLMATNMVEGIIKEYMRSGSVGETKEQKVGRYYSFMPLSLKDFVVLKKFNKYRETK